MRRINLEVNLKFLRINSDEKNFSEFFLYITVNISKVGKVISAKFRIGTKPNINIWGSFFPT
ncbi:hypothetical protein DHD05_18315 [Arenibacter sp. N53]|nr:hypothetical protein [Arenibacter sp. N53]